MVTSGLSVAFQFRRTLVVPNPVMGYLLNHVPLGHFPWFPLTLQWLTAGGGSPWPDAGRRIAGAGHGPDQEGS